MTTSKNQEPSVGNKNGGRDGRGVMQRFIKRVYRPAKSRTRKPRQ